MRKLFAYHPDAPETTVSVSIPEAQKLGSGATANVYQTTFIGKHVAAKIYGSETLAPTDKLKVMLTSQLENVWLKHAKGEHPQLAWPIAILRTTSGKDAGFLMPLIDPEKSFPINYFYDSTLLPQLGDPNESALSYKIEIARNLARLAEKLHEQGHYFVDVKPQNILVAKQSHFVSLLDCDGFSIKNGNKRFNAKLVSTDYISPEAFRDNLTPTTLGEPQDLFALAVVFFQLLNGGTHPFQGIVQRGENTASTNDEKSALGLYPHGLEPNPKIVPRPQSVHHLWADETRKLFDRAFSHSLPRRRPTAKVWARHFEKILSEKSIQGCQKVLGDARHMRFVGKECPTCFLENQPKRKTRKHKSRNRASERFLENQNLYPNQVQRPAVQRPTKIPSTGKPDDGDKLGWYIIGAVVLGVILLAIYD
jgi:DNA-binding helix-hairpin-helix protein with protein kinase domain